LTATRFYDIVFPEPIKANLPKGGDAKPQAYIPPHKNKTLGWVRSQGKIENGGAVRNRAAGLPKRTRACFWVIGSFYLSK